MPARAQTVCCLLSALTAALAAACVSHYQIHPRTDPPELAAWREEVERGQLRIRLEWTRPPGPGPFAAVIVHPEAGHEAREMRGILRSLAGEGYLAVAADYRRLRPGGGARKSLFAWRDSQAPEAVLELVRRRPEVDPERIGAMGYSQGGVYSLLIAAYTRQVKAVVAYYPISDFEHWLSDPKRSWGRRQVFKLIRRYFLKRSGARTDEEFSRMLARASPLKQAERIEAPVLLIHGDRDTTAAIGESRRLAGRLAELGREVELLEIEDAGHVFNFRDARQAALAWESAVAWLDRYLAPGS